jgi:hypothetical protein
MTTTNPYQAQLDKKREQGRSPEQLHDIMTARTNALSALSKQAEVIEKTPEEEGYFDSASKMLQQGNGGRPLRGWQLALQGFYDGANGGKNKKKIAQLDKIADTLSYIESAGRDASEKLAQQRKMAEAQQAITPSLNNYLLNAHKISPRDRVDFLNTLVKHYNQMTGSDFMIDSVDGVDPSKITLSSSQSGMLPLNLMESPLFAGIKDQQETEKLQKLSEEWNRQHLINETTKADADLMRANTEATYAPQSLKVRQGELLVSQQNANAKTVKLINDVVGEELDAKQDFLRSAPRMVEIVDKFGDKLWGTLKSLQWQNQDPSYWAMVTRQWNGSSAEQQAAAEMVKYINKMQIDVARGFQRPNQFLERKGSQAVPNFNMPAASFRKIMGEMAQDANEDVLKYNKRLQAISGDKESPFYGAWQGTGHYVPPDVPSHLQSRDATPVQGEGIQVTAERGGGRHTITLFKDGATKTIPTSDYAKSKALAKQRGYGVVE